MSVSFVYRQKIDAVRICVHKVSFPKYSHIYVSNKKITELNLLETNELCGKILNIYANKIF